MHLCRLRGVVFSPGSSTYNREQEGSAAAILSRSMPTTRRRASNSFPGFILFNRSLNLLVKLTRHGEKRLRGKLEEGRFDLVFRIGNDVVTKKRDNIWSMASRNC